MIVTKWSMVANQPLRQSNLRDFWRRKKSEAVVVTKLNPESEEKADKATIKCFGEGALRNARVAAGDWREQYKGLEAGDWKALRVTHGSQRLLMSGEPSMWANSPRRAHVNEHPFSAEESEDDELPGQKNQWCALLDASYHHNVGPVLLQYMGTTSTVSLSATCMFATCTAPVIRELVGESKW